MKFSLVLFFPSLLLLGVDAFHAFSNPKSITAKTRSRLHFSSIAIPDRESGQNTLSPSQDVRPGESLPLPPMKNGFLRRYRDTFAHLKDPEKVVLKRAEELGPVFRMYQFFMPTVVVGGQKAVREFIEEREAPAKVVHAALPGPFLNLQTKWSPMTMDSTTEAFSEAHGLHKIMLQSPEARSFYVRSILPEIEAYADHLVERVRADPDIELFLVPELKELCLQIFSRIFSGEGLSKEQVQMFLDFNDSLFTLSKRSKLYEKGTASREKMCAEFIQRFHKLEERAANGDVDGEGMFVYNCLKNSKGYVDVQNYERIALTMFTMIWGAYVECAATMINTAVCMTEEKLSPSDTVLKELKDQEAKSLSRTTLDFWEGMKYTYGVIRETLRTVPPGAGVTRYGETDFSLAGYRIPKGMCVQLDPRIGNRDPNLFERADSFEPLRWVPQSSASTIAPASITTTASGSASSSSSCPIKGTALKLGLGSFFPGGNGAYRCPGIPIAELVTTIFLASLSESFDSWELSGSGLNADGSVKYVQIPIQIAPDDLGMKFRIRRE